MIAYHDLWCFSDKFKVARTEKIDQRTQVLNTRTQDLKMCGILSSTIPYFVPLDGARTRGPLVVQFLSLSCRILGKIGQNSGLALPCLSLALHVANLGSATR